MLCPRVHGIGVFVHIKAQIGAGVKAARRIFRTVIGLCVFVRQSCYLGNPALHSAAARAGRARGRSRLASARNGSIASHYV